MLRFVPYFNFHSPSDQFFSQISLRNIKIYNSSNMNFLIPYPDSGEVDNVELENVTSSMFFFQEMGAVSIKNIYGKNIFGSILKLDQVFSQNIENLTFYNVSMSPETSIPGFQNLISLTRYSNITTIYGLKANADQSTVVSGLYVDVNEARG